MSEDKKALDGLHQLVSSVVPSILLSSIIPDMDLDELLEAHTFVVKTVDKVQGIMDDAPAEDTGTKRAVAKVLKLHSDTKAELEDRIVTFPKPTTN